MKVKTSKFALLATANLLAILDHRQPPPFLRTRNGGLLVARANEDTAAAAAATFQELGADGKPIVRANAGATDAGGQPFPVERANAVTAMGAVVSPLLSNYVNGMPVSAVDNVVNWFCPAVPVPVVFQYRNADLGNAAGAEANDQIGASGEPSVVFPNAESLTEGRLIFRGLETPFTLVDQQIAAAVPGNSADRERQRRVKFLNGTINRGRAYRTYEAVKAAASTATGVTIYTDTDPFKALRSYLEAVILEAESPEYVRLCLGYQVLSGIKDHPLINGVAKGTRAEVSLAQIAEGLGIPAANIMVSWHQVVLTAQGKAAAKSVLIGADQLYSFVCRPTPDEDDNSWMKCFTMAGGAGRSVYTYQPHKNFERIGIDYWEMIKKTNSAANAVKRLALTFSASATPQG